MRVKNIEERVARLATLVNGWTKQGSVPRIERDLALDELRRLYDALLDISEEQCEEQCEEPEVKELVSVEVALHEQSKETEAPEAPEAPVVVVEEEPEEVVAVPDPVADFDDALDIDALLGLTEEEKPQAVTEPEPEAVVVADPTPEPVPAVEPAQKAEPKVARGGGLFDIEDIPVRQKSSRKMISLYNVPTTPATPATPATPEPKAEPVSEPVAAPAPAPVVPQQPAAPAPQPISQPAEPQRVADVLGSGRKVLGDVSQNEIMPTPPMSKISDLRKAIGINDKFIMLRDLFGGNEAQYNATIDTLNSFASLDDCMIYIVENFAWNPDSEGAKLIVSLIERKLS